MWREILKEYCLNILQIHRTGLLYRSALDLSLTKIQSLYARYPSATSVCAPETYLHCTIHASFSAARFRLPTISHCQRGVDIRSRRVLGTGAAPAAAKWHYNVDGCAFVSDGARRQVVLQNFGPTQLKFETWAKRQMFVIGKLHDCKHTHTHMNIYRYIIDIYCGMRSIWNAIQHECVYR